MICLCLDALLDLNVNVHKQCYHWRRIGALIVVRAVTCIGVLIGMRVLTQ